MAKNKPSQSKKKPVSRMSKAEEAPKIRKIVLSDNRLNLAEVPEKRKRGRPRGTFSQEGSQSMQQADFQPQATVMAERAPGAINKCPSCGSTDLLFDSERGRTGMQQLRPCNRGECNRYRSGMEGI